MPPTPFFHRLEARSRQVDSLLCIGLDPHPNLLPDQTPAAARDFCLHLIEECAPAACAFKPNIAFFEALGPAGLQALQEVIQAVPDEIPVLLDAKRGDIASTADAYATSIFESLKADAVTASPFLGRDSLEPLMANPEHGVFVLCKTSNPGADDFQSLRTESGEMLYLTIARSVSAWNQNDNLGLVVGATDPAALWLVRSAAPDLWILCPGIGAQGGLLGASLSAGLRSDGLGLLVSASRSIATAPDPGQAAADLRTAINKARDSRLTPPTQVIPPQVTTIANALLDSGCVKFGQFTLKSGQTSPIYLDLRRLASRPAALRTIARAIRNILRQLKFDRLAAIPYGGLPIGTAVALAGDWPMIYPRRESKQYGTGSTIEGGFRVGETVVVLDDLITTGESKVETIQQLETAGLQVKDVVVLVDRSKQAAETLAAAGYRLHSVVPLDQLLAAWAAKGAITTEQYQAIWEYLAFS